MADQEQNCSSVATESPAGDRDYVAQQGDCVYSIADEFGLPWEKIWNDPANADLRNLRQNPNVLSPGDTLHIPDPAQRSETCDTDKLHRFVLKKAATRLVIVLKDFDKPRPDLSYTLTVAGRIIRGKTDSSGKLEITIPARASSARLVVGPPGAREIYSLKLGHMDPISGESGVEKRLRNLGYRSLSEFQERHHLPVTSESDDETLNLLRQAHGC